MTTRDAGKNRTNDDVQQGGDGARESHVPEPAVRYFHRIPT